MTRRVYIWRFRERWWYLVTAVLGFVMGYSGSFIEGDNGDLMVVNPTEGDGGSGFWIVLLISGFILVVGSLVMFATPRVESRSSDEPPRRTKAR